MRHSIKLLVAAGMAAAAPLLMAGGGPGPFSGLSEFARRPVNVIVVQINPFPLAGDPCNITDTCEASDDATSTAKQGTAQLLNAKGVVVSQVDFTVIPAVTFDFGCDTRYTENRFSNRPLKDFMPKSAVKFLYASQEIVPNDTDTIPGITSITRNTCVVDPRNVGTPQADGPNLITFPVEGAGGVTSISAPAGTLVFEGIAEICTANC